MHTLFTVYGITTKYNYIIDTHQTPQVYCINRVGVEASVPPHWD